MFATFFLAIGALFFWMVFKGFSDQEIKGRGWGFNVRIYRRDSEPIKYWVTFLSYLVCAVWSTVFGVLMALRMLSNHGA
jgi:ABC-type spermidine/putrescine transport system permease subunit I